MTTALHHDLLSPRIEERLRAGELSEAQVDAFREFRNREIENLFARHREAPQEFFGAPADFALAGIGEGFFSRSIKGFR